MASKYFAALFLFTSYSAQSMEITTSSTKINDLAITVISSIENEYVMCTAPMMMLMSKANSKEFCEMVLRRDWKNNKSVRRDFKDIFRNPQPITSLGDDIVGNKFVAGMVPLMKLFNKKGFSEEDCEVIARLLWQKNGKELRTVYQQSWETIPALLKHITLNILPEHALNIIGSFTKRSGKNTLRCVNKTLNAKIISQDKLYERYDKVKESRDKTEMNRLLSYNTFTPEGKFEFLDAIKDNNSSLAKYCFEKYCIKRDKIDTFELYSYIEAVMERGNNADILKMLIRAEKQYAFDNSTPLMLMAVDRNNIPLMRVLVKHGVDINLANRDGLTALMYAVHYKKIELIKELITYSGLDINKQAKNHKYSSKTTALIVATENIEPYDRPYADCWKNQSYDIIRALLDAGADPELADRNGRTPLEVAHKIVAKQIKKSHSEICTMNYSDMYRPLLDAESNTDLACIIRIIKEAIDKKHPLVNAGANIQAANVTNKIGKTTLQDSANVNTTNATNQYGFFWQAMGYK